MDKIIEFLYIKIIKMGFTFRQFLAAIIVTVLGIIAIRITFTFDINKYLENKRKIAENKAKNTCTHLFPTYTNDNKIAAFKSAFISPAGSSNWICQRCGLMLYDIDEENEKLKINYYFKNPKEYKKQEKKFAKLLDKAGY